MPCSRSSVNWDGTPYPSQSQASSPKPRTPCCPAHRFPGRPRQQSAPVEPPDLLWQKPPHPARASPEPRGRSTWLGAACAGATRHWPRLRAQHHHPTSAFIRAGRLPSQFTLSNTLLSLAPAGTGFEEPALGVLCSHHGPWEDRLEPRQVEGTSPAAGQGRRLRCGPERENPHHRVPSTGTLEGGSRGLQGDSTAGVLGRRDTRGGAIMEGIPALLRRWPSRRGVVATLRTTNPHPPTPAALRGQDG